MEVEVKLPKPGDQGREDVLGPLLDLYALEPDMTGRLFEGFCHLNKYEAPTTPIAYMIDESTGVWKSRIEDFSAFVEEYVFGRVAPTEGGEE